jgi:hypothetical protein
MIVNWCPSGPPANDQDPERTAISARIRAAEAKYRARRKARLEQESRDALAYWATVPPAPPAVDTE